MVPAFTSIQLLLAAVIFTLTALLVFIGVQVILILREVHKAAKKLNNNQSSAQYTPIGVLKQALYNSTHLANKTAPNIESFPTLHEEKFSPDADTKITNSPYLTFLTENQPEKGMETFPHISALQERGRQTGGRVFHRAGKPLA